MGWCWRSASAVQAPIAHSNVGRLSGLALRPAGVTLPSIQELRRVGRVAAHCLGHRGDVFSCALSRGQVALSGRWLEGRIGCSPGRDGILCCVAHRTPIA
jgi:hypothetical protein